MRDIKEKEEIKEIVCADCKKKIKGKLDKDFVFTSENEYVCKWCYEELYCANCGGYVGEDNDDYYCDSCN